MALYFNREIWHSPSSVGSLSRQNLPQLAGSTIEKANLGGYVAVDTAKPDITLVSTGSEVGIAVEAAELLAKKGVNARVVSMPCWEIFDKQSRDYQLSVFPDGAPILSVEAYTVSFFCFFFLFLSFFLLVGIGFTR